MKRFLLILLTFITMMAYAADTVSTNVTSCTLVTTTASTVLAARSTRRVLGIYTTSGAPNIWYREDGGTAVARGSSSHPLMGAQSKYEDTNVSIKAVSVVSASTTWVCMEEGY